MATMEDGGLMNIYGKLEDREGRYLITNAKHRER